MHTFDNLIIKIIADFHLFHNRRRNVKNSLSSSTTLLLFHFLFFMELLVDRGDSKPKQDI